MTYLHRFSTYTMLTLLTLVAGGRLRADPLTVTGSVMPEGVNFLYDFAIRNQSSTNPDAKLVSVDFPSLPAGSVVGNAIAPSGFGAATDVDYILFSYNNGPSFPVNVTTDGFQFVSTMKLPSISFEASYLNSAETKINVFKGAVSPLAAVPEPSTWIWAAAAFLLLLGRHRNPGTISRLVSRMWGQYSA